MVNTGAQASSVVNDDACETRVIIASIENANLSPQSPQLVQEQSLQQQNSEDADVEQFSTQREMYAQLLELQTRMKSAEDALVDYKKELKRRSILKREADNPSDPSKKQKGDKGKSKVNNRIHWCRKCRSRHLEGCSEATRRCNQCGELGHMIQECKNEVKCFNCGGKGHMSTACSKEKNRLKRKSDEAQESSKKLKKSTQGRNDSSDRETKWCDRCKSKHSGECSSSTRKCLNCRKLGHIRRDCKEGPRCYNCQKMGHISAACPSKKVEEKKSDLEAGAVLFD